MRLVEDGDLTVGQGKKAQESVLRGKDSQVHIPWIMKDRHPPFQTTPVLIDLFSLLL